MRLFIVLCFVLAACGATATTPSDATSHGVLLPGVNASLRWFEMRTSAIAPDRKESLDKLATFIHDRRASGGTASLVFICTHNSRRSQMGQLWAAAAAAYYGVDRVAPYSGGLEVTAFNPRAIASLERAGFQASSAAGENPHVMVRYATDRPAMEAFSKKYDDPLNPKDGFAAVMTCSHADAACPLVLGASIRVAIPYEDPKSADGTPEEASTYDARSQQIATEMLYLFRRVKELG